MEKFEDETKKAKEDARTPRKNTGFSGFWSCSLAYARAASEAFVVVSFFFVFLFNLRRGRLSWAGCLRSRVNIYHPGLREDRDSESGRRQTLKTRKEKGSGNFVRRVREGSALLVVSLRLTCTTRKDEDERHRGNQIKLRLRGETMNS